MRKTGGRGEGIILTVWPHPYDPPSNPTHDHIDAADDEDGDDDKINAWVDGDDEANIGIGAPPPDASQILAKTSMHSIQGSSYWEPPQAPNVPDSNP